MRWTVHREHTLHDTPWVRLRSLDVEQPDGIRTDYHVVRLRDIAVTAAVDDRRRVLMMWRHRFVTDTWAWELPMGLVEDGETPALAAARELEEETGWRPETMRELIYAQPAAGITDSQHFVFRADGARRVAEPTERTPHPPPARTLALGRGLHTALRPGARTASHRLRSPDHPAHKGPRPPNIGRAGQTQRILPARTAGSSRPPPQATPKRSLRNQTGGFGFSDNYVQHDPAFL